MSKIQEALGNLSKIPVEGIARDLLRKITLYHRIQGSDGIREAVFEVKKVLDEIGLESRLFEIPPDTSKGLMETPVSWNLRDGFVEFKSSSDQGFRISSIDRPTLVSAHSPPGEGCAELKICSNVSNCDGDAVLIEAPAYIAYKEINAKLIVLYDSKRHPDGIPYTGLFLRSNEIKDKSVVNINYWLATRLIQQIQKGHRVNVCWKIDSEYSNKPMYGLIAHSGEEPGVLFTSHICHPKPGAHDNASGVVANVLSALFIQRGNLRISHAHLFIPEYSGTIFMEDHLPWIPKGVVNLDMVGSKQWITNSTLNIVNAPLFLKNYTTPAVYIASKIVLDEASSFGGFKLPASRYSISPYTAGSDHDVTIIRGLDSTMLNEWPSKYYHTDLDEIDTISTQSLTKMALISSLAGYIIAAEHDKNHIASVFKDYLKSWYAIESYRHGKDLSRISRVLENQVALEYSRSNTPISMRHVYTDLGRDVYDKLRNIKGAHTFITVYAPLAHLNNVKDYYEIFQLENIIEWTSDERKLIDETWRYLMSKLR